MVKIKNFNFKIIINILKTYAKKCENLHSFCIAGTTPFFVTSSKQNAPIIGYIIHCTIDELYIVVLLDAYSTVVGRNSNR
jgi:hypothetical protein